MAFLKPNTRKPFSGLYIEKHYSDFHVRMTKARVRTDN